MIAGKTILSSLVLCVVLVSLIGNSYAQSFEQTRSIFIFVQTQIRNSDGKLVAYLEANKVFISDLGLLNKYLDTQSPQQKFVRAGQNYDLFQLDVQKNISEPNVISKTALGSVVNNKQVAMAYSDHDGYSLVPGDMVTSVWTIIRPSQ